MNNRSAQVGIEFMMLVIFIFTIFTVFYLNLSSSQQDFIAYKESREAEYISDKVACRINIAFAESDGFSANFTLPDTLMNYPYNITIEEDLIFVEWNDRTVFSEIVSSDVNGTISAGKNTISNIGGVIFVSSIL